MYTKFHSSFFNLYPCCTCLKDANSIIEPRKVRQNAFCRFCNTLRITQINTRAEFQTRQNDGRDVVPCLFRVYDLVEDKIQPYQMVKSTESGPTSKPTVLTTTLRVGSCYYPSFTQAF